MHIIVLKISSFHLIPNYLPNPNNFPFLLIITPFSAISFPFYQRKYYGNKCCNVAFSIINDVLTSSRFQIMKILYASYSSGDSKLPFLFCFLFLFSRDWWHCFVRIEEKVLFFVLNSTDLRWWVVAHVLGLERRKKWKTLMAMKMKRMMSTTLNLLGLHLFLEDL